MSFRVVRARPLPKKLGVLLALLAAFGLLVAGCGGDDEAGQEPSAREAPATADFPSAEGKSLDDVLADAKAGDQVVTPVGQVFRKGENRFGFGVFEVDRTPIVDADVAVYFQHEKSDEAIGPFPARVESLETKPAFAAMTTYQDPDAAKAVYVADDVPLDRQGEWIAIALIRTDDGLDASRFPSIVVGGLANAIPDIGDKAPRVETPTPASVGGDLAKIDTRVPPTDMHANFADVVGKKPVVLLFATPQLCQSRVCGPVVDVQAQVQAEMGDKAEFIHMEIFNDNDANKGPRPQVTAFNLETEPWLFVIDSDGIIRQRIEGAFGLGELRQAVRSVS